MLTTTSIGFEEMDGLRSRNLNMGRDMITQCVFTFNPLRIQVINGFHIFPKNIDSDWKATGGTLHGS